MFPKNRYAHTVNIKITKLTDIFDIIEWLETNVKHKWSYHSSAKNHFDRLFSFEDEEDAIVFALKYR
jgi:hypothetical protein